MRKKLSALLLVAGAVGALAWLSSRQATPTEAKAPTDDIETVEETEELPVEPAQAVAVTPVAAPAAQVESSDPVFFASWGGGPDQLGRETPEEGNPQGPMSFALDSKGQMTVLDNINGRLVRRGKDGKAEGIQKLDTTYPEDIALGADGSAAVLDRFRDKAVGVYDASGNLRGKLTLEGEGVPDPGSVTGVFVDGEDVYVERGHGPLVKIGNTLGVPAEPRTEIPGRPSRDGLSYLKAGIIEAQAGRVYVVSVERATENHRFTRELRLQTLVHSILMLDSDKSGTIYFAAEVQAVENGTEVLLYCLDGASGAPTGSAVLPSNTLPEESFKDFVVLDGGGVMHALRTESGVSYTRYDCL